MSQWSEIERANLRAYLGFSTIFKNNDPRLENAIDAVQSTADGGVLSSNATQERMRGVLTTLASIDTQITNLYGMLFVNDAGTDKVNVNATKAVFMLKSEGRRLINQLSIPLGTRPVRDYYSSASLSTDEYGGDSTFITDL